MKGCFCHFNGYEVKDAAARRNIEQMVVDNQTQFNNIENALAVERERINTFTALEEGSTTGDAELIDARTDYQGVTHENVGSHIRSVSNQISSEILNGNVGEKTISPFKTDFINASYQFLFADNFIDNYYWEHNGTEPYLKENEQMSYYKEPIFLKAGIEYNFSKVFSSVCRIYNATDNSYIEKLGTGDNGTYTPEVDSMLYLSVLKQYKGKAMLCRGEIPTTYKEGYYEITIPNLKLSSDNVINVSLDGTKDFTSVCEAVKSIGDASKDKQYFVYIHSGEYDLVAEQGGSDWYNNITNANGTLQGLLIPDYVHLIGIGNVTLKALFPDTVSNVASTCVSALNLNRNNTLENLTIVAKNMRYAIHDETDNLFHFLKRTIKNCVLKHLGNAEGLWNGAVAYGCGMGSGGEYNFINTEFYSETTCPFSIHNNGNQESNKINIDGCYFHSGNAEQTYTIRFGFFKENTNENIVCLKNSINEKKIIVSEETTSVTCDNVWKIYNFVNGTIIDKQTGFFD